MSELILHHYPASPISEKIRVIFGLKNISWRSVEIPNLPPKPDVIPLSGGYRRTPIMQIGADIFCDSQRILSEIERQNPSPSMSMGLIQIINHWSDQLFHPIVAVAIASSSDVFPKEFLEDRKKLFLGDYADIESVKTRIPNFIAQIRAQFSWAETAIGDNSGFLLGEEATIADASLFALTWFIRRRWEIGEEFMEEFPNICLWEQSIKDIGHGTSTDMTSQEALDTAQNAQTTFKSKSYINDKQDIAVGDSVSIVFDGNTGEKTVDGAVHTIDKNSIGLLHTNERVGTVCVHFPRVGYRIERI